MAVLTALLVLVVLRLRDLPRTAVFGLIYAIVGLGMAFGFWPFTWISGLPGFSSIFLFRYNLASIWIGLILATVPLALTGALLGLLIFGGTINVFSQIGAILLIGLSAKNGVLVVEFANQLRDQGRDLREAVVEAASVRLRPILMTSACTSFGALPLLFASGAGAESRQPIGIVIVFGVAFSAVLTLFVVPALYAVLAKYTRSPDHVARAIDLLRDPEAT